MKLGVDPTAPDIHLGHAVVLGKLREFQDAGHLAVLVIGDWTARVGDPSGRTSTRPMLGAEEIERNAATYREQAFRILDPERTEIRANGEWFSRHGPRGRLPPGRLGHGQPAPAAQRLRRADGRRPPGLGARAALPPDAGLRLGRCCDADVELGGTDQLFNLMLAREIQAAYGQRAPGRHDDAAPARASTASGR